MCKNFDETSLKPLYAADNIPESVDFTFHAAVRTAGDPTTDHNFLCPDEAVGCPYTNWLLCSWNATQTTQAQRVNFLTCWAESEEDPQTKAQACAGQVGIAWDPVNECASGDQGLQLRVAAAQYFEQRFPEWSKVDGPFNVPHVFVNDQDQYGSISYDDLLKALCAAGVDSGACPAEVLA